MGNSKVIFGGETVIDLTGDTVTPQTLAKGYTAHGADGEEIEGEMSTETVLYTPQTLTAAQKNQARTNIGAASVEEVNDLNDNKVGKTALTLDKHTDGLVYIFVDGVKVGNGVELGTVVEGDVIGVVDENNNILLSGALADGTYTFKYETEEGEFVEVGTLEVGVVEPNEPSSGNLADPTSADWKEGYRVSISSGNPVELAGHITTNFIPCKAGDVLRVKGLKIVGFLAGATSNSANAAKIVLYNSNKTNLGGLYGLTGGTDSYGAQVTIVGDVSTYTILMHNDGHQGAPSTCAYIRIDGELMSGYTAEDVVITINEEINDEVEPEVVNLIPTLTDIDLSTIYNGVGYKEDTRISVSSVTTSNPTGEKTQAGTTLLGLMPLGDDGDVLHLRGAKFYDATQGAGDYDGIIWCYDANGKLLNTGTLSLTTLNLQGTDANGDYTFKMTHGKMNLISGTAYIRFNICNPTGELFMTRNQLIPV